MGDQPKMSDCQRKSLGAFVRGFVRGCGLQIKQVAACRGVDPATFSRIINADQPDEEQVFEAGVAAGEARAGLQRPQGNPPPAPAAVIRTKK